MKLKHTPAPWRAKRFAVIKSDGYKISQSRPNAAAPEAWQEIDERYYADARLIAAAPEMLEALIKTMKYFDVTFGKDEEGNRSEKEPKVVDRIIKSIESATGMKIEEALSE